MLKIVTMQDISCIGKCSLTVALPVISSLGIEAIPLPTAVLSAHTMFQNPHIKDLTDDLLPIMEHWKKEGFHFDGISTGYLASEKQISIAKTLFQDFPCKTKVVDPCMADNGKLYSGFDMHFVNEMKNLCQCADVICPNITEACLLSGIPYMSTYTEKDIQDLLISLSKLGSRITVITGISFDNRSIGAYAYSRETDSFSSFFTEKEPQSFHGTGDMWAALFTASLVKGKSFEEALQISCQFVKEAINKTLEEVNHNTYGTNFEEVLHTLY